jgi:2'-5' RNA ligase
MSKRAEFQSDPRNQLRERYDQLWSAAIGKIRAGDVQLDTVLAAKRPDRRRGLTIIAQPTSIVRKRVAAFLDQLRKLEPEQYYYASSEFHVTVLSLFTATVEHEQFFEQTEKYVSAVDSALRNVAPIRIEFNGVTVSPGTVMIQGFVENAELNRLRDALRRELRVRGLARSTDQRYRLETAHMTVVRFRARLHDSEKFAGVLEQARQRSFGSINIRSLSLVKNDWYMTNRVLETVKRYRLGLTPST